MRSPIKKVGAILHRALAAIAKPLAFLDIACGDAGQMRKALAGTKVRHYHEIDLSDPALELAARNLAGVPFESISTTATSSPRSPSGRRKRTPPGAGSRSIISRRTGSASSSRPFTARPAAS